MGLKEYIETTQDGKIDEDGNFIPNNPPPAQGSLVSEGELEAQQAYLDQATKAGFGMADTYSQGASNMRKLADQTGTSMQQMAARGLLAGTPFGAVAGGALLPAAAGTAIQAAMKEGQMKLGAEGQATQFGALGKQASQEANLFAISALPSKQLQDTAMGYVNTYFQISTGEGPESAKKRVNAMLAMEPNPRVRQAVQAAIA